MPDGREGDNVLDVDTVCYSSNTESDRFYVPLSLATIERSFRIFRQSIYDESLQKLKELKKLWRDRNR
jgi:hypothetical protein